MPKPLKWSKLAGRWVVLVIHASISRVRTNNDDSLLLRRFNPKSEPIAARVVGSEKSGIWVQFLDELEAVKTGTMKTEDFGSHFLPFDSLESARVRSEVPSDYLPESEGTL